MNICLFDTILERHVCDSLEKALIERGHKVHSTGPIWRGHTLPITDNDISNIQASLDKALDYNPDVLFVFRASTLTPGMVRQAKKRGVVTIVWLPDDPVLYNICYKLIVDHYDIVLHCGPEHVMELYASKNHPPGINVPFWTSQDFFPYCFNPQNAEWDLIFLGNCNGPVRKARYDTIASLPISARIFGRVENDPYGIHGGYVEDEDNRRGGITAVLSRSKIALNIPQSFGSYAGSKYDFSELAELGSFQLPSRVVQYAASGIPVLSLGGELIQQAFPTVLTAQNRTEAAGILQRIVKDTDQLRSISKQTNKHFQRFFSARARAQLIEKLVDETDNWRDFSISDRARYYLNYPADCTSPDDSPLSQHAPTVTQKERPSIERQRRQLRQNIIRSPRIWKIVAIGTTVWGESDTVGCLLRSLENLGHDVLYLDFRRVPLVEGQTENITGKGPLYIKLDLLTPFLEGFKPDIVLCIAAGLCFRPVDAENLKDNGFFLLGLTLSDPDVQDSMIDHVGQFFLHGTNSLLDLERYRKSGLNNTVLFPFGIDRGYATATIPAAEELVADVICMGHANGRPERVQTMKSIARSIKSTRLYGNGWETPGSVAVTGTQQMQAMREGRIHVNFPRTRAGYINVKCGVFESVASGGVLCSEFFDEMERYFKYDEEIVGYHDPADLVEKLKDLKARPQRLEEIRRAAFARLAREHLYEHRWLSFFDTFEKRLEGQGLGASEISIGTSMKTKSKKAFRKRRIVVVGFYGANNAGDELILRSIAQNITGNGRPYKVVVAADNPFNVTREHALSAFSRLDLARAQSEVAAATAVLLGGGGLWHDYTFAAAKGLPGLFSENSISITGWSKIPLLAKIYKRPFHVFGMGVGPLLDLEAKKYIRFLGDQADSITVRDATSLKLLEGIEGWRQPVKMVPDPVYALDLKDAEAPQEVLEYAADKQLIGVNLRPWKGHDESAFIRRIATSLEHIAGKKEVAFLGLPFQRPYDNKVLQLVFDMLPDHIPWFMPSQERADSLNKLIGSVGCCSLVLSMRLHACIVAHRLGVPSIGLSYDGKVQATFEQVGVPELALPLNAREPAITATVLEVLEGIDHYKSRTVQAVRALEKEARDGFAALRQELDKAQAVEDPLVIPTNQEKQIAAAAQPRVVYKYYYSRPNEDLHFDSKVWNIPAQSKENWAVSSSAEKKLIVSFKFEQDGFAYINQDRLGFDMPPEGRQTAEIEHDRNIRFIVDCAISGHNPKIEIWVIEYSLEKRLKHTNAHLKNGENHLDVKTSPDTQLFRTAIRFSGQGQAEISPITLFEC